MIMKFHGKEPNIHPDAYVAPTAAIIGDVSIGKESSVWFGAAIRGDNASITVGEGTSVQDNATLHTEAGKNLTIGNNVTIGHNAIVHCASIGDNTLIGMGATVLDGAVIGSHCIIGAGALVKENAVVPDGTMMVGVPAKAVRELSEQQKEKLSRPSHYVELAKEYKENA